MAIHTKIGARFGTYVSPVRSSVKSARLRSGASPSGSPSSSPHPKRKKLNGTLVFENQEYDADTQKKCFKYMGGTEKDQIVIVQQYTILMIIYPK